MAKVYVDAIKYVICATIDVAGLVEKPDVIGALFGQTEGLLGEELDLRELQQSGRIGRIEVNLQPKGGRGVGTIEIPSSLDIVETSIIAAAIETVDRVGPYEAKIVVDKIADVRAEKRERIIARAKELARTALVTELPERREIADLVRSEVRAAELTMYGPERIPAGPAVEESAELILVEGRADVLNLLRCGIPNVIALGGATAAQIPRTIIELCKRKEVTLFIDGDRGGEMIAKEVMSTCDIDHIARAAPGKEVEELTRKEIIKALRAKIPIEQERKRREEAKIEEAIERRIEPELKESPRLVRGIPEQLVADLAELEGTLAARLYDRSMTMIKEIPVRDLLAEITPTKEIAAVAMDGIITQRLVDVCEEKGITYIVGMKIGNIFRKPAQLTIWAKE